MLFFKQTMYLLRCGVTVAFTETMDVSSHVVTLIFTETLYVLRCV